MTIDQIYKLADFVIQRQQLIGRIFVPLNDEEKFAIAFVAGVPYEFDHVTGIATIQSCGVGWTGDEFIVPYRRTG